MQINNKEIDGIQIFRLDGELDIYTSRKVEEELEKVISDKNNNVLLNLEKVPYLDSSGLSILIKCLKGLKKKKGALKLASVSHSITRLFELTNLSDYLDVYEDEKTALAAFLTAEVA